MSMRFEVNRWLAVMSSLLFVLGVFAPAAGGQQFVVKDGDTVVFYGDSITAQRLYTRFAEEFVLTRYPSMTVHFVNAGVPGDTVYGGYAGVMAERVQRDVAANHPAHITVMLGMNDGGYVPESEKIDAIFQKGYRELLERLHKAAPDASITLLTPTPYDEVTHGTEFPGYSQVIARNAEDVTGIEAQLSGAGDTSLSIVDVNHIVAGALMQAKQKFPQLAPLIIPDRIHPSETGHWILTTTLMSAWHVDPMVSSVVLNGMSGQVAEKKRTTITQVEASDGSLKWTQLDEALPLPLDLNNAMTPVLLQISDIAEFDRLMMEVNALKPGQYELMIDGRQIAVFTSEELAHGVNLALYKTPMLDQARGIDWMLERRGTLDQASFILSAEVKGSETTSTAEARLSQAQDELYTKVRKELPPKAHRFELRLK